jgi:hypothetical protein
MKPGEYKVVIPFKVTHISNIHQDYYYPNEQNARSLWYHVSLAFSNTKTLEKKRQQYISTEQLLIIG